MKTHIKFANPKLVDLKKLLKQIIIDSERRSILNELGDALNLANMLQMLRKCLQV
jgi:hypothetical protein